MAVRYTKNLESAGTQANQTGLKFEDEVTALLIDAGLQAESRYRSKMRGSDGAPTVLSVFVHPCKIFPFGLGIDTTKQEGRGSGINKLWKEIFDICGCWTCPGILIIEGDSDDTQKGRLWARSIVGRNYPDVLLGSTENLYGVFTLSEFKRWIAYCQQQGKIVRQDRLAIDEIIQVSLF